MCHFRWCGVFVVLASLSLLSLPVLSQSEEVVAWIEANAIPFSSTVASDDLSDLEPLRALIGDARIVGLGEQTHGTREFTTMKHRIIQFLVQEMGFTVVALESSLGGCLYADKYVQGGNVTSSAVARSLEQFFLGSYEFGQLLDWLRDYNDEAVTAVRIVGLDIFSPHTALQWFRGILPSDHPVPASVVRDIQLRMPSKSKLAYSSDIDDRWAYIEFVDGLVQSIVGVSAQLEAILDPWEMAAIESMPRAVEQLSGAYRITSTEMNEAGWWVPESWNYRDACMAENVAWWLERLGPDTKIILWAHNGHIAKQWPEAESVPMGETLASQFGEDYVSVGFSTCEGTFTSYNPELQSMGPLPIPLWKPESYGDVLCATGASDFFLDLRGLPTGTDVWDWMFTSRGFKVLGAAPDVADGQVTSAYDLDATLPAMFDIIVHIRSTTASR